MTSALLHSRFDDAAFFPWQSKQRLTRTKKALRVGAGFYVLLLMLLCISDNGERSALLQLFAIAAGLSASGTGAAKVRSRFFHVYTRFRLTEDVPAAARQNSEVHKCHVEPCLFLQVNQLDVLLQNRAPRQGGRSKQRGFAL